MKLDLENQQETQFETHDEAFFEELVNELPEDLRELAYEFGAFARGGKIKTPEELLKVVFLYCGVDESLRGTAGIITLLGGESISDTAVKKRLEACGPWIKVLLSKMFPKEDIAKMSDEGVRFLLVDGTTVEAPGATGTDYRVHLCIDLLTLEIVQLEITDAHVGESFKNFEVQPGDVLIGDRGYCHAPAIKAVEGQEGDVIVRLNQATMPLYKMNEEKLDIYKYIKNPNTSNSIEVEVGAQGEEDKVSGQLHVFELPKAEAIKARKRCKEQARKRGRKPSKEALFLSGYVLVFTTLKTLSSEVISELYRLRWQVELVIKRLKSLLNIDKLRAKQGEKLADVWLHGKLLYALLIEKRMRGKLGSADGIIWLKREIALGGV